MDGAFAVGVGAGVGVACGLCGAGGAGAARGVVVGAGPGIFGKLEDVELGLGAGTLGPVFCGA
ncbi:hypothetical protein EPN44_13430 [bacterium]|nr:MAG: hypothetical protein EPN44_13430 [bacterium]